jgi:hypothetical protein
LQHCEAPLNHLNSLPQPPPPPPPPQQQQQQLLLLLLVMMMLMMLMMVLLMCPGRCHFLAADAAELCRCCI